LVDAFAGAAIDRLLPTLCVTGDAQLVAMRLIGADLLDAGARGAAGTGIQQVGANQALRRRGRA
jgi:hypothetical protein